MGYAREQRSIDWGAVWAGLVWTIGVLVLLSSLWSALAFAGNGIQAFADNIEWWIAASAIVALLVGGIVAGWAPRARGPLAGGLNGMTVWGTLLTLAIIIGVPSVLGGAAIVGQALPADVNVQQQVNVDQETSLWATFWAALIGFGTAALGGVLGGIMPKRQETTEAYPRDRYDRRDDRDDRFDRDREHTRDDRYDRDREYAGTREDRFRSDDGDVERGRHVRRDDDVVLMRDDDIADDRGERTDVMEHEHDGGYASRRY
jgi:hypothetical protein